MADTAVGKTLTVDEGSRRKGGGPMPVPRLILALECSRPGSLSARYDLDGTCAIAIGRGTRRASERSGDPTQSELSVTVPDRWMSSRHARIEYSFGRWILVDAGSKNGSVVNGEPTTRTVLEDGDVFELGHTVFVFRTAAPEFPDQPRDLDLADMGCRLPGLTTLDGDLGRVLDKLVQVAGSSIAVLLEGESGTGKEVVARAAHAASGRPGDFVAVNCGAIPANLVESELFGHKKGAFSGALEDRVGMVRSADRGTLFLDEIGDLPAASQAALLRVLQEREVTPVGATRPIPVDLRVVAATHRDVDGLVAGGAFRQDLFARLAGFRLTLPRLADRRDDLGLLIGSLHRKLTGGDHPGFQPEAVRCLFDYAWPLNIRELEQALATAVVLAGDSIIELDHLPEHIRDDDPSPSSAGSNPHITASGRVFTADDLRRRDELLALLREHQGNISAIARAMGKDRKQIQRWVKRYHLRPDDYRS